MTNGYTSLHRSRYHCHIAMKMGLTFIYDNSGDNPDETDDGPLVVAVDVLEEAGGIKVQDGSYGPYAKRPVRVPVESKREDVGEVYSSHTDLEGAVKLGRRLGLKVDMVTNIYDPKPKN